MNATGIPVCSVVSFGPIQEMPLLKTLQRAALVGVATLALASTAVAGPKVTSGSLAGVLQYKNVKVVYDYDGMTVGKKLTEDEYVAREVAEKNEKEAGKGDAWKESWYNDRESMYHRKFEQLINKYTEKAGMTLGPDLEPDMLMTVKITRIEPGFYIGISKAPAFVDMTITLATPDGSKEHAVIMVKNSPGSDMPAVSLRVSEAFAKAAKDVGKLISTKGK